LLILLLLGFMSNGLVSVWIYIFISINVNFSAQGEESHSRSIGIIILSFCLLMIFSYLRSHPEGFNMEIFGEPKLVYFCTLLLLAIETLKIK
jgi:hypothetical protein